MGVFKENLILEAIGTDTDAILAKQLLIQPDAADNLSTAMRKYFGI